MSGEVYPAIKDAIDYTDFSEIENQSDLVDRFMISLNNGMYVGEDSVKSCISDTNKIAYDALTEEYLKNVMFPDSPYTGMAFPEVHVSYAYMYFGENKMKVTFEYKNGNYYIATINMNPDVCYFPAIQEKIVEPIIDPNANAAQKAVTSAFVAAINSGSFGPTGAMQYIDSTYPTYPLFNADYLCGYVFPNAPATQITSVCVFEDHATAKFGLNDVYLRLMEHNGTMKIIGITVGVNTEYFPTIFSGATPKIPPVETSIPEQTAAVNGFVNAVNTGDYSVATGVLKYIDNTLSTYDSIDQDYFCGFVFVNSPTIQITDVAIYSDHATAKFNGSQVTLNLLKVSGVYKISKIVIGSGTEFYPTLYAPSTEPIPPPRDLVQFQTLRVNAFVNAVNNGRYGKTGGGALSFFHPAAVTYAKINENYMKTTLFSGSPNTKLTDVKVYSDMATAKFAGYTITMMLETYNSVLYISKITSSEAIEYYPALFSGKFEPPTPPAVSVTAQAACANGLFNAISSADWTGARKFFNPNASGYRSLYQYYLSTKCFPGAPTTKVTNIRVYETYASADFGIYKIYLYYSLLNGAYKVFTFTRLIPAELYPTLNWNV